MDIKIAVATHKKYWMPEDDIYMPIHVGKALHEELELGYIGDNTGDNISDKNESFCELTGLYWLWKNIQADYKGIVHYRRHFTNRHLGKSKQSSVLKCEDFARILSQTDILLPKRRKYYIETNKSHYDHAHYAHDLMAARAAIKRLYPDYLLSFDRQMQRTSAHMFNMMVMREEYFDSYCEWLFSILFEVEKCTDISQYDAYQRRLYGFLSEILLDVWLECKCLPYKEICVTNLETQHWGSKIGNFLLRKYCGKKRF